MSTQSASSVKCSTCGAEVALLPIADQPGRVQAFCNHGIAGQPPRSVYEGAPPALEPAPSVGPEPSPVEVKEQLPPGQVQVLPGPAESKKKGN